MKTNKEIVCTVLGREYKIPKGATVEENNKSSSGYFISPSNFGRDAIAFYNATHYGFVVKKEDIEM